MTTGRILSKKTTGGSTLPEIGKIKVGEKKKSSKGTEYPSSLDYFKATGNFEKSFNAQYGARPTSLVIAFASDDIAEVCNERFECWTDGKRWGYGDGETFTVWDSGKKEYVTDVPKSDPRVTALKWDMVLTLRFVLIEIRGILGYWTFQTKAKATTIPGIVKAFDFVKERAGTIVGFPFSLIVDKVKGYNPGEARQYPIVKLVPNFSESAIEKVAAYLEQGGNMHKVTTSMVARLDSAPKPEELKQLKESAPVVEVGEATLFDENGGAE